MIVGIYHSSLVLAGRKQAKAAAPLLLPEEDNNERASLSSTKMAW